jgi:hypothetical protein
MFRLQIETDNAAFDGAANLEGEISRLLRHAAETIRQQGISELGESRKLYDINGNPCGFWGIQRRKR